MPAISNLKGLVHPSLSRGWRLPPFATIRLGHRMPFRFEYRNLYHQKMKTTLDLNDQLLAHAKVLAVQQRTSLTRLIEEGLQLRLRAQATPKRGKPRLPVFKGRGGLAAGLDSLSNKALLAALGDDA
jgi:hypothetical protein